MRFLDKYVVLCRTQIFRVSSEYERRFSSIFEHEHHRALDIRTSSGTNISDSNQITQYGCNYVDFMEINILIFWRVFPSISEIRTSSGHEHIKNGIFELRASTNAHFSERERASIEQFEVRLNTKLFLTICYVIIV